MRIGKRGRTNKYDSIKGLTADFPGIDLEYLTYRRRV